MPDNFEPRRSVQRPSAPQRLSRATSEDFGDDPFANLGESEIQAIEGQAVRTGKRTREVPVSDSPRKRMAVDQRSGPVDSGDEFFPELTHEELKELDDLLSEVDLTGSIGHHNQERFIDTSTGVTSGGRPLQRSASNYSDNEREVSDLEYVPPLPLPDLPGSRETSAQGAPARQATRRLNQTPGRTLNRGADVAWPPEHDLKIYSHNSSISRNDYQGILRKIGLSGDYAYGIEKGLFDRKPSPDVIPFMAMHDDDLFRHHGGKIDKGSEIYINAGWDRDKPVYYAVNDVQFSKLDPAELKILGLREVTAVGVNDSHEDGFLQRYAGLNSAEKELLVAKRVADLTNKFALIEFTIQKNNASDRFRSGKSANFHSRQFGDLSERDKQSLFDDHARRAPHKEITSSRNNRHPNLLAASALARIGFPERFAQNPRNGWPLLIDARNSSMVFESGRARRPPQTNQCILIGTQIRPTYHRLNADQTGKISDAEKRKLGLIPAWTRSLDDVERYKLGLLPPGSTAIADAEKFSSSLRAHLNDMKLWSQTAGRQTGYASHGTGTGREASGVALAQTTGAGQCDHGNGAGRQSSADRSEDRLRSSRHGR